MSNCCRFDMDACLGSGMHEGDCQEIGGLN